MDSSGGEATKLLDPGGGNHDLRLELPMGRRLFIGTALQFAFRCSISETRQTWELISHPTYDIHGAELSPDGNWVAFHLPRPGSEPLKIAPVREGKAAAEAEWITVTTTAGTNRRPWWSSDGNLLYFISARDNYIAFGHSLWTQQRNGRVESLWPSTTFTKHAARSCWDPLGFGPAVGGGRIVFALVSRVETSGWRNRRWPNGRSTAQRFRASYAVQAEEAGLKRGKRAPHGDSLVAVARQVAVRRTPPSAPESAFGQRGGSPLQARPLRPVTDCHCVAVRRGGEQQEVND